jgi:hypothetical protein
MKRATLTAYPTTPPSEPADLTDRLLQREDVSSSAPPARGQRKPPRANQTRPKTKPAPPATASSTSAPAATRLEMALAASDSATESLRQAAREAPARYEVALHYRLDALAHHLQQVKEFVANLAAR